MIARLFNFIIINSKTNKKKGIGPKVPYPLIKIMQVLAKEGQFSTVKISLVKTFVILRDKRISYKFL